MATMKKMVAKKATKKYNNGGDVTTKDKSVVRNKDNSDFLNREKDKSDNSSKSYNSEVTKSKDNSRMKSTTDNSVTNVDRGKVKYKIAKGATVSFAKSGKTIKKAQNGVAANPRKGLTDKTQPVNSAGEVTTGMANPYNTTPKPTSKPKLSTGFKNGGRMKKAKNGAKFDLNKDGKTTFKDVLIGRGVLSKTAKSGAKMKSGGSMKKCRYGCK